MNVFVRLGFRECLIEVARKNGKTTLMAAIALYELVYGDEGAEIYSAATKRDQAKIVYDIARDMVKISPDWKDEVREMYSELRYDDRRSKFKAVSKESKSLDGLNPSLVIIDEAAIEDPNTIEVMETAMHARESALLVYITTAQPNQETAYIFKRDYLKQVLDGDFVDERILVYCMVSITGMIFVMSRCG